MGAFSDLGWPWPAYLAVAVAGAALGYLVNRIAQHLTFAPVHPRGGPLRLQGTVPRSTTWLAARYAALVDDALLSGQEIMSRLDPEELTGPARGALARNAADLTTTLIQRHRRGVWEFLPEQVQQLVLARARAAAPALAQRIIEQIEMDVADVLDLRHLVETRLAADPPLLADLGNRLTAPAARPVRVAGALIGLLLGLAAAGVLDVTGAPLVLPVFGLLIGLLSRTVAIRVVNLPALQPRLRRHVSTVFAQLVSEIVTFDAVLAELLHGSRAPRLHALVHREVRHTIDAQASVVKPVLAVAVGSTNLREMRNAAGEEILRELPRVMAPARRYAHAAMAVRDTVWHRAMRTRDIVPALLRPVLEAAAWRLTVLTTLLGLAAGIAGWVVLR